MKRILEFGNVAATSIFGQALSGIQPYVQGQYRTDVTNTWVKGRIKINFIVIAEQEISKTMGVFERVGYDDYKTESSTFIKIGKTLNLGFEYCQRKAPTQRPAGIDYCGELGKSNAPGILSSGRLRVHNRDVRS